MWAGVPGTGVCKGNSNNAGASLGKIDVSDAVSILKHIVASPALAGNDLAAADANADNKVDVNDVVAVLRAIVGLNPAIPSTVCP